MSGVIVFGAGGRAGRRVVAAAIERRHRVTAVVRDPAKHTELATSGAALVGGDVTDQESVARLAAGHEAAIMTAVRLDQPSVDFYRQATTALINGLSLAGVQRLVLIGIGTVLEVAPGVRLHDTPGFPAAGRAFSLGHLAQLEVLTGADPGLDWVVLAPPPVILTESEPTAGAYRTGSTGVLEIIDPPGREFSYSDLALALVDEITTPRHHRALVAVGPAEPPTAK